MENTQKTSTNGFKEDLLNGQLVEKELIKILQSRGNTLLEHTINNGCDTRYDIKIESKSKKVLTIEVKDDKMSEFTGNLAIEFQCNKKPSGISVSEADYYAIKTTINNKGVKETMFILIRTQILKQFIANNNCRVVSGGDWYRNKMYLVDRSKLLSQLKTTILKYENE